MNDKSTPIDKSHGMVTKPAPLPEQSLPLNGGNDYGRLKSSSKKLKSAKRPINQPKEK